MSDSSSNFSFPHRTPVFTTLVVMVCFAVFGWLALRMYAPHAYTVDKVEGQKSPAERRALLDDHRKAEHEQATTYGWVDQKTGVTRIPIEQAIKLTAAEHAKK